MQKEAAKLLATRLRSNSYRYFAFSPNGENPALLLDTKRITAATFKQRCTPELGIAYRSGSIFVGEIVRDGRGTPLFRVDEQQSTGQIDASKAVLGFNRLRKKLGDVGVRPPEIAKVRLQVGDDEVEDEEVSGVEDENPGFAEQILAWTRRWQAASGRVDGALDDPQAKAALLKELKTLRDDMKLGWSEVEDDEPAREEVEAFHDLRGNVYDALDRLDAERGEARARLDHQYDTMTEIQHPKGLDDDEKYIRPLLTRLNTFLKGGQGRNVKGLVRAAHDLVQACIDRATVLAKRTFKDKKKIAAIRDIQRQAEEIAAALEAQLAFQSRSQEVQTLLREGETERALTGINAAQLVKDENGKVRYIVKSVKKDNGDYPNKVREFGKEVTSGAVANELCDMLGLPRMVTTTVPVLVPTEDGPALAAMQDAWDGLGDFAERFGRTFDVDGETFSISLPAAEAAFKAGTLEKKRAAIRKGVGRDCTDEQADRLMDLVGQADWQRGLEERPLPVTDEDLAEDIAASAIVDLITGQRDHVDGKEDNMMLVQTPDGVRVRPIDYGMSMPDLDDFELLQVDFGAWSKHPAAAVPMKPEMLDALLTIDPDALAETAKAASERAAKATREPGMRVGDDQVEIMKLQAVLLKEAIVAAKANDARVSARDLAELFSVEVKAVLASLQTAFKAKEPWRDLVPDKIEAFKERATVWAQETAAIEKQRTALARSVKTLRAGFSRLDGGEDVDLDDLAGEWMKAGKHLSRLRPLVEGRRSDKAEVEKLGEELEKIQARFG